MMKKFGILLITIMLSITFIPASAQEAQYHLIDLSSGEKIGDYTTYAQAQKSYNQLLESYEELAIYQNEKLLQVAYGIVQIGSGACDTNFEFINALTSETGYTNGCYGADALYLETDETGTRAKFMISGVTGWGSLNELTIIPLSSINQFSSYRIIDGRLFHQVRGSLTTERYASLIDLGEKPDYLEENAVYLSYDGHYFYNESDFMLMSDDLRAGVYTHAVNADQPYFNYYQYVSHRTMTEATSEDIRRLFQNEYMISGMMDFYLDQDKDSVHDVLTQSQYYGSEGVFFEFQNLFGTNALMMLALSMNESATGRSSLSYTRNNLFGHAAYDSDVEKNAARYLSVANSVYSHAKNYISASYLNPDKFQYHGGFFGNKASGMNVSYASDPYWGEKAAQFYMKLDEALGSPDKNSQCLAIKTSSESIPIEDEEGNVIYYSGKNPNMSFVVLEALEDRLKIQLDPALSAIDGNAAEYTYDFLQNVAYIARDDIQILLHPEAIHQNELVEVYFDAKDGSFSDGSSLIHFAVKKGTVPDIEAPVKENAVFDGWDSSLEAADTSKKYSAVYREIKRLEMETLPETRLEYNDRINLKDGRIRVTYADDTVEILPLTTSMISGYNVQEAGLQTVTVQYGGATTSYSLEVVMELDAIRNEETAEIAAIIEKMKDQSEFSEADITRLINLRSSLQENLYPWMSFSTLRSLDQIYARAASDKVWTVIEKNSVNLAASGLHLALPLKTDFADSWLKDSIRLGYQEGISDDSAESLLQAAAIGNGYEVHETFSLYGKLNFDPLPLLDWIIVSLDIPEGITQNQVITVLQEIDGEVVKLATQQTANRLSFKTNKLGNYMIVTRNSVNTYAAEDVAETHYFENNGFDLAQFMRIVPAAVLAALGILILIVFALKRRVKRKMTRY